MPRGVTDLTLRDRLLEQARVLLRRGGSSTFTARALAEATGVSVGVLYNHFPDLNTVMLEVVVTALSESATKVADRVEQCASLPVESLLVEVGTVMLDDDAMAVAQAVFARPHLTELVGRELSGRDGPVLGEVEDLITNDLIRRTPHLEPRVGRTAARLFVALIHEILRSGSQEGPGGEIETAAHLIARGVSASDPPATPGPLRRET